MPHRASGAQEARTVVVRTINDAFSFAMRAQCASVRCLVLERRCHEARCREAAHSTRVGVTEKSEAGMPRAR